MATSLMLDAEHGLLWWSQYKNTHIKFPLKKIFYYMLIDIFRTHSILILRTLISGEKHA